MAKLLSELITKTQYPSGETHLQVHEDMVKSWSGGTVIADLVRDFNGLMDCMVADRVFTRNGTVVDWVIPFMPFARDDRRNHAGDGSELELALEIAERLGATCIDPHSDVAGQMMHFTQAQVVNDFSMHGLFPIDAIIAIPDAGAAKKAYTWLEGRPQQVVQCLKKRDTATGKLSGFEVLADTLCGQPVVIVDDICDAGGTFLGLAEQLKAKGAGPLSLAVTHGLFTKGTDVLRGAFDKIYTLDIYVPQPFSGITTISTTSLLERYEPV